ncbi:hypothetical protein Tco_0078542 [Tanacetum coccineum]
MNYYEPNPCYDSNYSGFDQFEPPQFPVIHQPIREKTCAELLAEERAANINTQPMQYSVVHQPPQEETSLEFLQDKRNLINYVQTFLRKFNRFSFYETPKVVSLAWETISEIEHAFEDKQYQPEGILELFRKLHDDVQNIHEELAEYINTPSWNRPTISCDDDDDEYSFATQEYLMTCSTAITPDPLKTDSLITVDKHLDTILETELVLDSIRKEKMIVLIIESYLLESLLNRDTLMASSPKIDSLFDEFTGELITIPPRIVNREHEEYISLLERLIYDNSSPRPPEDFQAIPNTIIESLPTFPIPIEDSDSLREEIDIFPGPDDSILPGIESDDYNSEVDNNSTSLPEFESFHVDYSDSGDSTIDVVEDIPVDVPNILPTHTTLHMDFDFILSHNDLGSDLDVSSPSGDRNKIYDPRICIEVESTRFLATFPL